MPCMVSESEEAYYNALALLKYVENETGLAGKHKDPTVNLCGILGALSEEQIESIVYNAHSRTARRLADWWEDHQEKDRERK